MIWNYYFRMSNQKKQKYFDLSPGNFVDLQINHPVQVRIKTQLIGYDLGQYIILKYPDVKKVGNYRDVLVEGNVVIVRYLIEGKQGECFAFRSTIRNITKYPEKFLMLTYPNDIENRELRRHQRFTTHLPAMIMLNDKAEDDAGGHLKGIIADISTQGCGFVFKSDNPKIKVKERDVVIKVQSGTNSSTKIPGRVCNSRFEEGKVNVGVKFEENDKQVKDLLDHLFIESSAG